MAEIENLTEETLAAALADTPGPLIVDFHADWCGPCRVVGPTVARLAREHPEIRVAKVDIDEQPGLAAQYGVYGIPTVLRFDGGEEAVRVSRALRYADLLGALGVTRPLDSIAA